MSDHVDEPEMPVAVRVEEPIDEEQFDDVDEQDQVPPELTPISYFGADFDVYGLVRRFNQNSIIVPTFDGSSQCRV